ncbi:uncharacterized protein F4807DRAFT_460923 [Annulohypoxylon truncatum]|uniref:uncharacterized protein n=1 Tax=Annulohypoxylon truncatum TaxID=327061 RepID=UPI00200889BA|nr:uncharacterized protein F4807DRAFT_460923 [Annulohypoxylon truncatum]KAI1209231.1 hypothetical protein F4807DRAFT_460923 [Annulohypoxylon truncatum]
MSSSRSREKQDVPEWAYRLYSEEEPEFWIYDNYRKNLEGNQEFTITVKRRSEHFGEADYVKLVLLEPDESNWPGEFFPADRQTQFAGTKRKRWNGCISITFDDLVMITPGVFRIQVEIMQYRGGSRRDILLDVLTSKDIEFPEIAV